MIFRREFLEGIRRGVITVAFRRWRRPTVRRGGTLLTAGGQLAIRSVDAIDLAEITTDDARRAGYESLASLVAELDQRAEGAIYRIELGALEADPRVALREAPLTDSRAVSDLRDQLRRLDARAVDGPWTMRTLELLLAHPGVRAGDLCRRVGQAKDVFKGNVRKLKALGLTESLEVGYHVSPRGEALLKALRLPE